MLHGGGGAVENRGIEIVQRMNAICPDTLQGRLMLVLSREPGEAVIIDDVVFTLARVADGYVEASLRKTAGGSHTVITLPHHKRIDICYGVQVVFIEATDVRATLGFEHPPEVTICRRAYLESAGPG